MQFITRWRTSYPRSRHINLKFSQSTALPLHVQAAVNLLFNQSRWDLHHSALGRAYLSFSGSPYVTLSLTLYPHLVWLSITMTGSITQLVKVTVGRLGPGEPPRVANGSLLENRMLIPTISDVISRYPVGRLRGSPVWPVDRRHLHSDVKTHPRGRLAELPVRSSEIVRPNVSFPSVYAKLERPKSVHCWNGISTNIPPCWQASLV